MKWDGRQLTPKYAAAHFAIKYNTAQVAEASAGVDMPLRKRLLERMCCRLFVYTPVAAAPVGGCRQQNKFVT